jgi:hypothetical protein
MAARFGLTRKTYSRSETGDRPLEDRELLHLREDGINIEWLLTGEGEMTRAGDAQSGLAEPPRGIALGGGGSAAGDVRDGRAPQERTPRITAEEAGQLLRRTRSLIDQAVSASGGWRPPRLTEEALLTMLFTLGMRGAEATIADVVEFLGFLRQDLDQSES